VARSSFRLRLRRPRFRGTRTPLVTVRYSVRRLVFVATMATALCVAVYVVSVQTTVGQTLADLILYGRPTDAPGAIGAATDALGTISLAFLVAATAGLGLFSLVSGRPYLAAGVVTAIVGANVTTQILKDALERPLLLSSGGLNYGNSFPSGHVTVAASLAFAVLLVAPRPLRRLTALGGAAYMTIIGVSTIATGWHRLADALGAVLIALAWAAVSAAVVAQRSGSMPRRTWARGAGTGLSSLLVISGGTVAFSGVALLVVTWSGTGVTGPDLAAGTISVRLFVGALAIAASAALISAGALLWALAGVAFDSGARRAGADHGPASKP
jgi:membrane-associated phospholipid phosphatase